MCQAVRVRREGTLSVGFSVPQSGWAVGLRPAVLSCAAAVSAHQHGEPGERVPGGLLLEAVLPREDAREEERGQPCGWAVGVARQKETR